MEAAASPDPVVVSLQAPCPAADYSHHKYEQVGRMAVVGWIAVLEAESRDMRAPGHHLHITHALWYPAARR